MRELFESTAIGSLTLRNRFVRSATWAGVGDEKGYVTERAFDIYRPLAEGEIGLIITGYQYVMTNGIQLPFMIGAYADEQIEGLSRIADMVHECGGSIVPQLVHALARANVDLFQPGDELWGCSAITDPSTNQTPIEMGKTEIERLIEAYATAALRSKKAGFDGIQLHGAHGYGINQFLSPAWNKRTDAYGGSTANRYRLLGEVMEAVKAAVGDDFPILIKLNAHDFVEGGLTPEESVKFAKRLAEDGIAAIEVSGGCGASPHNTGPVRVKVRKEEDEAYFADMAAFFKQNVRTPIMCVGGIRSFKTAQDIVREGKADYVSLARPFVREPGFVARWKSGDTGKSECISCNGCFGTGIKGQGISCKALKTAVE